LETTIPEKSKELFEGQGWISESYPNIIKMLDKIVSKYRKVEVLNPDAFSDEVFIKPNFF